MSARRGARASSCPYRAGPTGSSNADARLRASAAAACPPPTDALARRTRRATPAADDPRADAYRAALLGRSLLPRQRLDALRPAAEPDERKRQPADDAHDVGIHVAQVRLAAELHRALQSFDHDAHDEQRDADHRIARSGIDAGEPQRQHGVADGVLPLVADAAERRQIVRRHQARDDRQDHEDPAGHEPQTWMTQRQQHETRAYELAPPAMTKRRRSRRRRAAR